MADAVSLRSSAIAAMVPRWIFSGHGRAAGCLDGARVCESVGFDSTGSTRRPPRTVGDDLQPAMAPTQRPCFSRRLRSAQQRCKTLLGDPLDGALGFNRLPLVADCRAATDANRGPLAPHSPSALGYCAAARAVVSISLQSLQWDQARLRCLGQMNTVPELPMPRRRSG
ncbi:hypothetical protein K491DRAFT_435834 [Lophiostoma macrostomum CBS 122681]|uniref:Uncharacterized protein n=1 Tax=Lophiostoma macrostomum CBS 122681 TaxID=1314788 RepID=A0A6A6T7F6_9PLEO|nr:hypothetical protein K491DRAFT_435834 [Lophiostoma macrostomum CBS 122681]